jgi:hypothetical protein
MSSNNTTFGAVDREQFRAHFLQTATIPGPVAQILERTAKLTSHEEVGRNRRNDATQRLRVARDDRNENMCVIVWRLCPMIRSRNPNLFENGIADVEIPPRLGMNVGDVEYQDSGIQS